MRQKIKNFSLFTCIVSIIFLIDFLVPTFNEKQIILKKVHYRQTGKLGSSNSTKKFGLKTNKENIPISLDLFRVTENGDSILIKKTCILRIVKEIEFESNLYNPISVYNMYSVLPISVLISGIFSIRRLKKEGNHYFNPLAINIITFILLVWGCIFNHFI